MNETPKQIYELMSRAAREMPPVGKWGRNRQQNYDYLAMDDIMAVLGPILARLGIVQTVHVAEMSTDPVVTSKGTTMFCSRTLATVRWYAPDGSYVESQAPGRGTDTLDREAAKASTDAVKSAIKYTFCIADRAADSEFDSTTAPPRQTRPEVATSPADTSAPRAAAPADTTAAALLRAWAWFDNAGKELIDEAAAGQLVLLEERQSTDPDGALAELRALSQRLRGAR